MPPTRSPDGWGSNQWNNHEEEHQEEGHQIGGEEKGNNDQGGIGALMALIQEIITWLGPVDT